MLSAFGIMFLYLVIVRVIEQFRGFPETLLDRVVVYGAGAIGLQSPEHSGEPLLALHEFPVGRRQARNFFRGL